MLPLDLNKICLVLEIFKVMVNFQMKTVILAGGFGTRLSEETDTKPKPMVEIGGRPLLWHIMRIYAQYDQNDFIIACGYKGEMIKDYFANFHQNDGELIADKNLRKAESLDNASPSWSICCVDTGYDTMTGGRLLRLKPFLTDGRFMVTYGDGVSNINIEKLLEFHKGHGKLATVTAVRPPARFGGLEIEDDKVTSFVEKSPASAGWINGGFFVFEPDVLNYIDGPSTKLEAEPLSQLAQLGELMVYRHQGFWKPMDTLREMRELETLWNDGNAPWTISEETDQF